MQRLGRVAAAVLQAHSCLAAELTLQQAAPAFHQAGCWGRGVARAAQHSSNWADSLQRQQHLHSSSSSSSSSLSFSKQSLLSQPPLSNPGSRFSSSSRFLNNSAALFSSSSHASSSDGLTQPGPLDLPPPEVQHPGAAAAARSKSSAFKAPPAAAATASTAAAKKLKVQGGENKQPAIIQGVCKRKNIRLGWKKLDFVLRMVRRSFVDDAMAQLAANPKKAAMFAMHAVANARNNAICAGAKDPSKLWVAEAFVTKGQYSKQIAIMGRGYSGLKETRRSHLTVKVRELDDKDPSATKMLRRTPRMVAPLMVRQLEGRRGRTRRPLAVQQVLDV